VGNFYVNFTTRGVERAAVANSLRSAKRKAFVGPTLDTITVFFEQKSDTQNESEIKLLGENVSKDLNAPVLAVLNHDDDILAYWLFEAGNLVDEYNSCPGYFTGGDRTPAGGDAKKLCAAFGVPANTEEVHKVLSRKDYVFALQRHEALAKLLSLPSDYVFLGYEYIIDEGDPPEAISELDLERVG
jgi:hypothetical protein